MNYRVKLNEVLYFARFDGVEIICIKDDAPGALDGARVFIHLAAAQAVAAVTGGTVVEVEEESV